MKNKILISDSISDQAIEIFENHKIDFDIKTDLDEKQLIEIIPMYTALVVRSATKVTSKIIDSGKNLKVIGRAGAGVDNIDLDYAKKRDIIVMNTPGGNSNATAEHTLALMLSLIRKIPIANNSTHDGKWEKKLFKGSELSKKTIGLIGFGNVSIRLTELLKGFNVNILVFSESFKNRKNNYENLKDSSFEQILNESDILSLHCKSRKDGKPIISINELKKMKKSSYIINTARGNIINENDLNNAINDNIISGAAIDVFSNEPAKENILFNNDKVILTPHIAASTSESQIKVAEMIADQISDYLLNNNIKNNL